jgi:hypothetical protein
VVGAALVCAAALVWASVAGDSGPRASTASPTADAAGATLVAAAPRSSRAPAVDAAGQTGRPGTLRSSLPEAQVCAAYDVRLRAVGGGVGPLRWSLASGRLPAGLRLDAGGRLLGVPLRAGTAHLVVVAAGSSGRAARERVTLVTRPAREPEPLASLGPWPRC